MRYNAHKLFHQAGDKPCFRCELVLTDAQERKLLDARRKIRAALRQGLSRAWSYLKPEEIAALRSVGVDAASVTFAPKFRTQGSWAYGTLNRPARKAQQLDLDDGMYVPMSIIGANPAIASNILFNIVDRIIAALCEAENWRHDDSKSICVRVEIDHEAHLDLNIYAIPDAKMVLLEKAMHTASAYAMDAHSILAGPKDIRLDPSEIYVAHRHDGWEQSDPLELEEWFVNAVDRHSGWTELKRITRYLKAWRDHHWQACQLSSIVLMVCAVQALDEANSPPQPGRDDDGLLVVVRALADKLKVTVYNPVVEDRALNNHWTLTERNQFELKARAFANELNTALNNESSVFNVVERLRDLFGDRLPDEASLVTPLTSISQVRSTDASYSPSPSVGSQTSG